MASLDPASGLAWALAGGLVGGLAGLVPGLHANTIAAVSLALVVHTAAPAGPVVPLLLGALGAWTFTNVIPLIVLGVPEGEDAPALLPGQRMASNGHVQAAIQASATGSLAGLVLGAGLALIVPTALATEPIGRAVEAGVPFVAAAAIAVLVLSDPAGPPRAAAAALLAGGLGAAALSTPVPSPIGLPATPLMPLFIGLFGLPALLDASQAGEPEPAPARPDGLARGRRPGSVRWPGPTLGAGLGLVAGSFPGFTSGPATAVATLVRRGDDAELMATTSAVNTATACVATGMLHAAGRTRSGVHVARQALAAPPPGLDALAMDLAHLTAGTLVGLIVLASATRLATRLAASVPRLARWLVVPWVLLVVAFTGPGGLAVLLAAWACARATRALGTRRSIRMAALLLPALVLGLR